MTAALEGGEWSTARPGSTLSPGKTRYPFYRRLGGPQGWSGRAENLVPTGIYFFIITSGGGSTQLSNDTVIQNELHVEHWRTYEIEIYMVKN